MQFCSQRKLDPIRTDIRYPLDFLMELHKEGLSYSTIKSAHSTLSEFVKLPERAGIGTHHLVCRLIKGLFNIKPPQPSYI